MSKKKVIEIPRWLFVLGLLITILLVIVLWSKLRQNEMHLRPERSGELRDLLPSYAGIAGSTLIGGNAITIHQNGEFFEGVLRDIAGAQRTIHFETYVWWKGEICNRVAEALAAKAKQGVKVRVLLDGSGSSRMDEKLWDLMKRSGVEVAKFHPVRFSNIGRLNNRDHRKIVVIDGHIGWTGGHGVAEEWTGNAQDKKHWRDTFVRVEGPVVNQLQAAFTENWIEETGRIPVGPEYFPQQPARGNSVATVAFSSPAGSVSNVQLLYSLAMGTARHELVIQNPYFLPHKDSIDLLRNAVKNGVRVMVMIPSADVNDSAIVQHASHHRYGALLEAGVEVYEYQKTLLHQKVMIVDGQWSMVGSTNFDERSFDINDEVTMGIYDPAIAAQLREAAMNDLRSCKRITQEEWKHRGFLHRLQDAGAWSINSQL